MHAYAIGQGLHLHASIAQLVDNGIEMLGAPALQHHIAARSGHSAQESAAFNAVGHHGVLAAVELFYPFNGDAAGAVPSNFRSHFDKHFCQIGNFRLLRGVFKHGYAIGQGSSHQEVFSASHSHHVGGDFCAFQTLLPSGQAGMDVAVADFNHSAHGLQTFDVLLNRARTNGAATWQRNFCLPETRQQRPQRQNGSAHGFYQLIRGFGRDGVGRMK